MGASRNVCYWIEDSEVRGALHVDNLVVLSFNGLCPVPSYSYYSTCKFVLLALRHLTRSGEMILEVPCK